MTSVEQLAQQAQDARSNWLEDVLSGLLINGVKQYEIGVEYWPDNILKIRVRGDVMYEHRFTFVNNRP